jgi:hypothetical protein
MEAFSETSRKQIFGNYSGGHHHDAIQGIVPLAAGFSPPLKPAETQEIAIR